MPQIFSRVWPSEAVLSRFNALPLRTLVSWDVLSRDSALGVPVTVTASISTILGFRATLRVAVPPDSRIMLSILGAYPVQEKLIRQRPGGRLSST